MARLIGYMANRTDGLGDALHQERAVTAPPDAEETAGWGIGFYQGDEVLHRKRPRLDRNGFEWSEAVGGIRTDCAVIHWRRPTVGGFRAENTHPFRMRSWVFAHNGTLERFESARSRLLEAMPDFLRRNIRGETDSEHLFHVILSFLHDAGHLDVVDVDHRTVIGAIRSSLSLVDRIGAEVQAPPATLNFILTNGRALFAYRRGKPMMVVERQGLHDVSSAGAEETTASPATLRYVMVVSDGAAVPREWREIDEDTVCVVDHGLRVSTSSP